MYFWLSGNKYNAVALGAGFEMNSTTDAGNVNNSFSTNLAKRFLLMGIIISLSGLTTHIKSFSGLERGLLHFGLSQIH